MVSDCVPGEERTDLIRVCNELNWTKQWALRHAALDWDGLDSVPFIQNTCVLSLRYDVNHCKAGPWTPNLRCSTAKRVGWSTVSNAALRSSRTKAAVCFSSTARTRSLCTQRTAVSVEWPRRCDDWWTGNSRLTSAWWTNLLAATRSINLDRKLRLEMGRYELRLPGSNVDFFSLGRTTARFCDAGRTPDWKLALQRCHDWGKYVLKLLQKPGGDWVQLAALWWHWREQLGYYFADSDRL